MCPLVSMCCESSPSMCFTWLHTYSTSLASWEESVVDLSWNRFLCVRVVDGGGGGQKGELLCKKYRCMIEHTAWECLSITLALNFNWWVLSEKNESLTKLSHYTVWAWTKACMQDIPPQSWSKCFVIREKTLKFDLQLLCTHNVIHYHCTYMQLLYMLL